MKPTSFQSNCKSEKNEKNKAAFVTNNFQNGRLPSSNDKYEK